MLKIRGKNITLINQKLIKVTWPFILIVVLLFVTNYLSTNVLSSIRAFVTAEGFYSKAQKDATYFLNRYATFHSKNDYQRFIDLIAIPIADHEARLALQKDPPDLLLAKESFIKAKNHPQDIDGMIKLFLRCYSFNKIQDPILLWVAADRNIEALKFAGQKLHQSIEAGNIDKNTLLPLIDRINKLS